jgi:hypothetical protein
MIPASHPLRTLFLDLVKYHFTHDVGLRDQHVSQYIANMLTEFCAVEQLYKIRDASGRVLTDVGEMLLEADPVYGEAPSFDREREVRKHIGDYTLFFTGMFPESINWSRLRRQRLENFIDFVKAGKESYYIVSKFEHFEHAQAAPLFKKLSDEFERCVFALNLVKSDLDEMQHPIVQRSKEILM